MTHMIEHLERPADLETWLVAAGIDYVEVLACPDEACEVCRAEPAVAAAA